MIQKILLLLVVTAIGIGFYWLLIPTQQVNEIYNENSVQYKPNVATINQQVADKFLKTLTADATDIGPDIDPQANDSSINAKLSGAIKAITTSQNPTPEQLNAFYQNHKSDYKEMAQFVFLYRVFYTAKYGGQSSVVAEKALKDGIAEGVPLLPDTNLPEDIYLSASSIEVDEIFGIGFADKLDALSNAATLPCWAGPISSKVGAHLVCIKDYQPGRIPALSDIKNEIINDWRLSL